MTLTAPKNDIPTTRPDCPLCGASNAEHEVYATGTDFEYQTVSQAFTFRRCASCGVGYLCPRPAASTLSVIYPPNYIPYTFDSSDNLTLRMRSFLERRKIKCFQKLAPTDGKVLDVGCGTPAFLNQLKACPSVHWELWGNDISEQTMEALAAHGHKGLAGRIEEIDMPHDTFDLIFFRQVIEHLETPLDAVRQAAKSLVPGGRIILETPNEDAWDARWFKTRYWGGYHFPRHWTLFTPQTIGTLATSAGLEVESISFMLSPSFWVQSAHHYLTETKHCRWGARIFSHLNPLAMGGAVLLDLAQLLVAGKTSNMRAVLRRPTEGRTP